MRTQTGPRIARLPKLARRAGLSWSPKTPRSPDAQLRLAAGLWDVLRAFKQRPSRDALKLAQSAVSALHRSLYAPETAALAEGRKA